MRFVSFVHEGNESFGLSTPTGIADVGSALRPRYPELRSLVASGCATELALDVLEHLAESQVGHGPPLVTPLAQRLLNEGDVVEVEISELGCLRNTVERG